MKRRAGDRGIEINDAHRPGQDDDGRRQDMVKIFRGGQDTGALAPGSLDDGTIRAHRRRGASLTIPVRGEAGLLALTIEQQDAALLSGDRLENPLQPLLRNLFGPPGQLDAGADFQHRGQGAPGPGMGSSFFRRGRRRSERALLPPGLSAAGGILRPEGPWSHRAKRKRQSPRPISIAVHRGSALSQARHSRWSRRRSPCPGFRTRSPLRRRIRQWRAAMEGSSIGSWFDASRPIERSPSERPKTPPSTETGNPDKPGIECPSIVILSTTFLSGRPLPTRSDRLSPGGCARRRLGRESRSFNLFSELHPLAAPGHAAGCNGA